MYKKRKKIEKKYIVLITILFLALFIGFAINIVKTERNLSPFEKIIKDSVLFVNKIVYAPISFVSDKIEETKEKNNLYEKYKELENDKESIESLRSNNDELKKQLNEMKDLLNLNSTLVENSYLNASVINRNLDFFSNTLTIDKGENNGVEIGLAVVTGKGLIGRVINTSYFNSTVKLLTSDDINNKISVKIKNGDNYVYGILSGYKDGYLIIEGIDTNKEIIKDSIVTTTGLGGIFPSGIYVGKVSSITKDNFDLSTTVLIKSDVDFDDINFVTILKRIEEWFGLLLFPSF